MFLPPAPGRGADVAIHRGGPGTSSRMSASLQELGVPVKSVSWVRLHPGQLRDGSPSLLVSMGQDHGGMFVCDIDLRSGHCRQYTATIENAAFPTASFRSAISGVLYLGSTGAGHLHCFDPEAPDKGLADLGAIDPELCSFPCEIDEGPDGSIYIGAHPGASLTRFDPRTKQFQRFGRMDPTDMYFYPRCGADGTVAGIVRVIRPHLQLFDPRTGEQRTVGPVFDAASMNGPWNEKTLDLVKDAQGMLYLKSIEGNFRLAGLEARQIESVPPAAAAATLPDGIAPRFLDEKSLQFRRIELANKEGNTRELSLDWKGGGSNIFLIHQGPDGKIYGSSAMPEHLFRCELDGSGMIDLGQCSLSMGDAYSMGNAAGKLYIASYPGARLSVYDPSKPYRFGEDDAANPRDLGRIDDAAYRPRAMLTGPAGKVWIGSIPDYGTWGGTLVNYDPGTGRFISHRHVVPDCSVVALEWLPELKQILVGTSVNGGSGTTPRASQAAFAFWDPLRDEAVATETFGLENIDGIMDLRRVDGGNVYAVIVFRERNGREEVSYRAELVLLDVRNRRVIDRSRFGEDGWPLELSLRAANDGSVYGACLPYLYRIAPGSARREVVWKTPIGNVRDHVNIAGPIVGDSLYFASGPQLRKIGLAGLSS